MSDVVVTVPKNFRYGGLIGLAAWISEGDPAGEPWSGQEWDFYLGGNIPRINTGERVYIVCNGRLRGYAPLVRIDGQPNGGYSLVRGGNAIAVTIQEVITGFRGFRYRWWERSAERPFLEWQTP